MKGDQWVVCRILWEVLKGGWWDLWGRLESWFEKHYCVIILVNEA